MRLQLVTPLALLGAVFSLVVGPQRSAFAQPAPRRETVEVTGRGAGRAAARADAIRQAIQQTQLQFVIADREISNDAVLRDQVLSTVNGFVEGFDVVEEHREGTDIAVRARVTVSSTSILPYIAASKKKSRALAVESDRWLAEVQAQNMKAAANRAVLARMAESFSYGAVEAFVIEAKPDPLRDQVAITIGLRLNALVLAQVNGFMKALVVAGSGIPHPQFTPGCIDLTVAIGPRLRGEKNDPSGTWLIECPLGPVGRPVPLPSLAAPFEVFVETESRVVAIPFACPNSCRDIDEELISNRPSGSPSTAIQRREYDTHRGLLDGQFWTLGTSAAIATVALPTEFFEGAQSLEVYFGEPVSKFKLRWTCQWSTRLGGASATSCKPVQGSGL